MLQRHKIFWSLSECRHYHLKLEARRRAPDGPRRDYGVPSERARRRPPRSRSPSRSPRRRANIKLHVLAAIPLHNYTRPIGRVDAAATHIPRLIRLIEYCIARQVTRVDCVWAASMKRRRESKLAARGAGSEGGRARSHVLDVVERGLHLLLEQTALLTLRHQVVCERTAAPHSVTTHTHATHPCTS
ncbi:hypothetical protein EVAR_92732_1 [Eumeta japonica]|uniref:Uncharacterized protein n=1 Tax=Eumeta variegata TaxID=151549 RepID=A0A4C1SZZ3_EUMVA|nr:hypothetical protein EVAR_92732_1 [Eumeta japonica]